MKTKPKLIGVFFFLKKERSTGWDVEKFCFFYFRYLFKEEVTFFFFCRAVTVEIWINFQEMCQMKQRGGKKK